MEITAEMGVDGFAVYLDTIGRWDDDPGNPVEDEKKQEIADRLKRALESLKERVYFF